MKNDKKTANKYRKKLNGYRATHRNKWLLIQGNILTIQELSLLDFYIDISDWDKNHDNFGMFKLSFIDISKVFGCSENTIRNWHKKLIDLDFIRKSSERSVYLISHPFRYISPGLKGGMAAKISIIEKNQPIEKIFQSIVDKFQHTEEFLQPIEDSSPPNFSSKSPSIAIVSSKDDSKVYSSSFGIDDEDWIKEHVDEND